MNRKIVIGLLVLLFASLGAVSAQPAGDGMRSKGMKDHKGGFGREGMEDKIRHAKRWEHMMGELGLTDDQKKKIKEQRYETERERIKDRGDMKLMMHDLKYEFQNEEIDTKKVDKLVSQIGDLQKEMLKSRIDSMLEFRNILTKEQWDKIKDMKLSSFDRE